jgi:hypothetical protein
MALRRLDDPYASFFDLGARFLRRLIPPGNTASTQSIEFASMSIRHCLLEHPSCRTNSDGHLPTRVLDIRQRGEDEIKLRPGRGEKAKYACLSHCWGSKRSIITTKANMASHMSLISWEEMPKTFQEAITFARSLEIQFLWIDSLCIIQDDQDDWYRESARMTSIYANSFITFAATNSPDADAGLFSQMSSEYEAKEIAILEDGQHTAKVYARKRLPHPTRPRENETPFPLLSRAWVYQERLLSPRVLHFLRNELMWECQEMCVCECNTEKPKSRSGIKFYHSQGIMKASVASRDKLPGKLHKDFTKVQNSIVKYAPSLTPPVTWTVRLPKTSLEPRKFISRDPPAIAARWAEIVGEYSRLALSFHKDKLPALSGLAQQIQTFRSDQYLAGLWSDDLLQGLLWNVWEKTSLRPRPSQAVGPTWSWASVNSGVSMHWTSWADKYPKAEIFEAEAHLVSPDPYGETRSGFLVLSGLLIPAVLHYVHGNNFGTSQDYKLEVPGLRASFLRLDYDLKAVGSYQVPDGMPVFCLRMQSGWHCQSEHGCLVIRLVEEPHVYQRIGVTDLCVPVNLRREGVVPDAAMERAVVKIV